MVSGPVAVHFAFDEAVLAKAITSTFQWRHTAAPAAPIIFTPDFAHDWTRQTPWLVVVGRHRLDDAPREFGAVIEVLTAFLPPIREALHHGQSSHRHGLPGGPRPDHA